MKIDMKLLLNWCCYYLFALIIGAIIVSNFFMLPVFISMDWTDPQTFIEVLRVILFWVIGIEFARLLLSYQTEIVIELMAFVVARKLLLVEDDMMSVTLGIVAIIVLFMVREYIVNKPSTPLQLTKPLTLAKVKQKANSDNP